MRISRPGRIVDVWSERSRVWAVGLVVGLCGGLGLGLTGCGSGEVVADRPTVAPGVTFTGPRELRGTIGSMTRLDGTEPLLVSRYGVLVNLPGTGSGFVPEFIETWLVNEMRKLGVGRRSVMSRNPEWQGMTPQRILRDPRTAIVRVTGAMPPGATRGSRFDLLVEALEEDTTTTSLAGGQLWQTDLGVNGALTSMPAVRRLAIGRGPVYVPPYEAVAEEGAGEAERKRFRRRAVIVGGGLVLEPRRLEIILNQESFETAGVIQDAINSKFRIAPDERTETAVGKSPQRIELNVPRRYAANPQHLVDLIAHTYPYTLPIGPKVDEMVAWMATEDSPEVRRRASLVIKALGPIAAEHLSAYYDHADMDVRLAVLEAGAYLRDGSVAGRLIDMADSPDAATRIAVASGLVHLPRSSSATSALRKLLSDAEMDVRMAAYETLVVHGDPMIDSLSVRDRDGEKFVIDRVPSDRPSVYIAAEGTPRIVLFAPQQGFRQPVFASLWGNRMTLLSPSSITQASMGLEEGNTAFLPVVRRGPVVDGPGGVKQAEVFDAMGGTATVRASNERAVEVLTTALPSDGSDGARYLVQGRVSQNVAGRLSMELLGVDDSLARMPLSVYYRSPLTDQPTVHRVSPTVATLAFFLAHYPTMEQPQEGLDLDFGQVVDVLYRLGASGAIPADVQLAQSRLADEIAGIRSEAAPIERPETDGLAPGRPDLEPDLELDLESEGDATTTDAEALPDAA